MSYARERYRAPRWLRGGHAQTIYPALFLRVRLPRYRRERWETPDGDFIDLDYLDTVRAGAPRVALFHGLEGSSSSHYAAALGQGLNLIYTRMLPRSTEVSSSVRLEQPEEGGHVGFVSGAFPGNPDWLPQRLLAFFGEHQALR